MEFVPDPVLIRLFSCFIVDFGETIGRCARYDDDDDAIR